MSKGEVFEFVEVLKKDKNKELAIDLEKKLDFVINNLQNKTKNLDEKDAKISVRLIILEIQDMKLPKVSDYSLLDELEKRLRNFYYSSIAKNGDLIKCEDYYKEYVSVGDIYLVIDAEKDHYFGITGQNAGKYFTKNPADSFLNRVLTVEERVLLFKSLI